MDFSFAPGKKIHPTCQCWLALSFDSQEVEYIGSFRLRWLPTQCGSSWEVESSLGTPHLANKASRH